jgi:hypothetical protein
MTAKGPDSAKGEDGIVKFRPRTLAKDQAGAQKPDDTRETAAGAADLSHYERDRPNADDYRHRMLANVAAIVFTALLTVAAIWLTTKLKDLRDMQDCVLTGRRDCARISSPSE